MIVVRQQRVFDRHGAILLAAVCLASVATAIACRRKPPAPLPPLVPQISGTLAIDGVTAPVRIVRDTWGVPHIYAATQDDLFFAQGFVQAQDRLFQMDLWRRSAQGRLSEVLGPNFIERDAMTRRFQYRGDLAADWASYGPDAKAIATAFVRGLNAWIALSRQRPPEEFALAGWQPEPWSADDLLDRTEAFRSSGDALDEVFRARLIATVGVARARMLLPGDRAIAEVRGDPALVPDLVAEAIRRVGTPAFFLGLAAPVTQGTIRTQPTGDAEQIAAHPSPRYFVHLNAPGWNVIGATSPWRPGIAAGHNDRVAWTTEPAAADTQDVYVEQVNPTNPRQVEDGGRWVDIDLSPGTIPVRGRKIAVTFDRETTRHGVIVASDLARHHAFAVRWSGAEPGTAAELAAIALDRADSAIEFRSALARWKMPARRVTYRDADGRRGSTVAALTPVRHGSTGALPAHGGAEWSGWTNALDSRAMSSAAPSKPTVAQLVLATARLHPARADAVLQQLGVLSSAADSLTRQRAAIVDLLADAMREQAPPSGASVLFTHPLAVTAAARGRFNVLASAPTGGGAEPFAITFDTRDWDRSTAILAPGQSGSPDSPHFADLAALWSAGQSFPLAFTEGAVQAHAVTTLTLTPK